MSVFVKYMLDLSTGHLTEDTQSRMAADSVNYAKGQPCTLPFVVKGSSHGWFIDVRDRVERSFARSPYPSDVVECYELALRLRCDFILFDHDAERHPELPWYGDPDQQPWVPRQPAPAPRRPLLSEILPLAGSAPGTRPADP